MDNSNQFLGLFFAVITSILIAITFFLYLLQKASVPVVPEYIPQSAPERVVSDVVIETSTTTTE